MISQPSEKKPKQKKERPAPLAEISANIPRGFGRSASAKISKSIQRGRQTRARDHHGSPRHPVSFSAYRQGHEDLSEEADSFLSTGWPDEPSIRSAHSLGSFPYATYSTAAQGDHRRVLPALLNESKANTWIRFNLRERHPVHSLNPFSISNRGSPTSMVKQGGGRGTSLNNHNGLTRVSARAQHPTSHDISTGEHR
jgi:hypothetical protein